MFVWIRVQAGTDVEIACRDPVYYAIKSSLWDLFPAWEDRFVDAAFREMLWASQGGRPQDPLQTRSYQGIPQMCSSLLSCSHHRCLVGCYRKEGQEERREAVPARAGLWLCRA